jgi:hypothetical protein
MIIAIIFILLIILGVGFPLVLLILPKQNLVAIAGLSFPLGIGIFTFVMFIANIFGVKFSPLNEFLIFLILSIPLIVLIRKRIKEFYFNLIHSFRKSNLSPVEKVMLGVLAFLILTSFINTFYWPVHIWDSVVLYDFRGHVFAQTGFMKAAFIDAYYYSYPLLTSLAHTIVYLSGGKYPQFIYSLFYLSLGVSFYGLLREFVSRKIGLLFTLILLTVQPIFYHSLLSLTNLPFSVYLSLGAICIYLWDRKRERGYLILSAFLTGLSTWTRSSEPFWVGILLVVFIVSIYRRRLFDILTYSLFFFPIREVWKVFQSSLSGVGAPIAGLNLLSRVQWLKIVGYLYEHVVVPWGVVFPVFIIATISLFLLKKRKNLFLIFFITFVLLSILVAGTIELSLIEEDWYRIGDAAQRLSMLFYPLFIYTSALAMGQILEEYFN